MASVAKDANMPGAVVTAHNRAAVVEAYVGDKRTVAMHLGAVEAAAVNAGQKAGYHFHSAIALSRAGKPVEERAAAAQFASAVPSSPLHRTLDGILALDAKDYQAAETAIGGMEGKGPLSNALRAELLMRTARKTDGQALPREVLAASLKVESNAQVDFLSLIARLRAASR